jgi:hypothetical protein
MVVPTGRALFLVRNFTRATWNTYVVEPRLFAKGEW